MKKRDSRVTIRDVAKRASVSISTASYALNNNPNVSKETRKRVLDAARELNYYPNASARNLKTNKTGNIGFFIYGFDGPIFGDILEGVNLELQKANYNIVVSSGISSAVLLREQQVDAAIIFDSNLEDETIYNFAKRNVVVLLDRTLKDKNIYDFQVENKEIVCVLLEEIIAKGYKKIAYLSGPIESPSNQERFACFEETLKRHKMETFKFYEGDFTINTGYKVGVKIAKSGDWPDFVFCANDESAIGLINAFNEFGIDVPNDISVAGFDGILLGEYIKPRLTTIQIDYKTWGYNIAQFIISYLQKQKEAIINKPTAKIIYKESTK
ncbi:MAG: LacI family transcriptional regulator [Acholeplasmataceae bacterium]|nr:LacI family transcriptional regulator [Acholeplasmataceae bacterium]